MVTIVSIKDAHQIHEIVKRVSLSFCLIMGLLIFCRGYLLNRNIITDKSSIRSVESPSTVQSKVLFNKTILVLVDALRYDFMTRMKFVSSKLIEPEAHTMSCPFKFVADPPTTTMQRLKALMTGTMPTFVDVSANFNSYVIEEDNLIYQLYEAGYKIGFLGDDTWLSLFPPKYFTSIVEGHPSFNAWDLDTVDYAINSTLHSVLGAASIREDWDVLITHFLGVDHCGHRYGPNHPEMERKLNEIDASLEFIYNSMESDALLVIFGDHGMTTTGDHGGDSNDEIQSTIIFLSKEKSFNCQSNIRELEAVAQIDLVPTLATILQVPIPFSSIGQVIPNFLPTDIYTKAIYANVVQVHTFIKKHSFNEQNKDLEDEYRKVINSHEQFLVNLGAAARDQFHRLSSEYLHHVKDIAVSTWTQFDLTTMALGFCIFLLSLTALLLCICLSPEVNERPLFVQICQFSPFLCTIVSALGSISSQFGVRSIKIIIFIGVLTFVMGNIIHILRKHILGGSRGRVKIWKYSSIPGLFYGFTCMAVLSNSFVINEGYILGYLLMLTCLFHCCAGEQNDIIDLEDAEDEPIVNKRSPKVNICSRVRNSWFGFGGLILIVRVSQIFFRCREELTTCTEEFLFHKDLSSLPKDWMFHKYIRYSIALISLAILVVSLRNWMLRRKCILSLRPSAVTGKYIPSILVVLLCVHWALQGLSLDTLIQVQIRPLMHYFPTVFEIIALSSILIMWWKPLCCIGSFGKPRKKLHNNKQNEDECISPFEDEKSTIDSNSATLNTSSQNDLQNTLHAFELEEDHLELDEMSNDVYSSSLLIYGIIIILLLTHVTSIGFTPVMTCIPYVIVCLLVIYGNSTNAGTWSSVISWTLASQYFFYATGHQPIFSTIPWDSAFLVESSNDLSSSNPIWINWIRPAVSVFSNLHISQIIFSTSLPILILRPSETQSQFVLRRNELLDLGTKFIILHGLKLLGCMICVAILRRHLMVWKIFTPKFIFEGISLIVVYIITFISILFILRIEYLLKISKQKKHISSTAQNMP